MASEAENQTTKTASLEQILKQELAAAKQLTDILNREGTAIRERNASVLTAIAPEKLQALKSLEALEEKRLAHSTTEAAEPSTALNDGLGAMWDRVIDVIRVCDRKNQLNGIMLRLRQETVQRAIDLISNRDSGTLTYSPDGSTKSDKGPNNTWASA